MRMPFLSIVVPTIVCAVMVGLGKAHPAAQSPTPPVTAAVVVHRSVTVTGLRLRDLADILLGERQSWPRRARIVVVRPAEGPVWNLVRDRALRMSESAYLKTLATSLYRGLMVEAPRLVDPPTRLRRTVAETPGAIGILPLAEVDDLVSVVTIDGRGPHDPDYVLRNR